MELMLCLALLMLALTMTQSTLQEQRLITTDLMNRYVSRQLQQELDVMRALLKNEDWLSDPPAIPYTVHCSPCRGKELEYWFMSRFESEIATNQLERADDGF